MRNWMVLIAIGLTAACAPVGAPSSVTSSPSAAGTVANDAPAASVSANAFTMPTDRDMISFAADRGALIAFSTKDTPPPYESKVQRADATTNAWRTIYTSDSHFGAGRVANGRVGLAEYREPFQGGGAYSVDFTVVDLMTGTATAIDRFALSSATFRGGGGGPRRPVGSIVLGPDRAAWTRLAEGPGGAVTGELRVALLADPARSTQVASSAEWIAPLGLDAHRLLYAIGGTTEDQLHIHDLDTGADKIVVTGAVGDQQREGVPGFNAAVLTGDWAVWLDTSRSASGRIRAVNVVSGADRTIDAGGSSCGQVSAGSRYVAWYCATVAGILDARTLELARDLPVGVAPEASDDALLWFTVIPTGRTATLYRPR
jgi:hypothetical protein